MRRPATSQSISREWTDFARERIEQNFNRFDSFLRCRTPQDFAALQSELLRDNLESFLQCARRVAEKSVHVADELTRKVVENVEHICRSLPHWCKGAATRQGRARACEKAER